MLLESISALNAFPNEQILVSINDPGSISNMRLGINIIDGKYAYNSDFVRLNWTAPPLSSNFSTDFSDEDLNDETVQGSLSVLHQPEEYVDIPEIFPLIYQVDDFSNYLNLSFLGGTSAITVFPSTPYPIIDWNNDILTVSAGFIPLTAFNEYVTISEYRQKVSNNLLQLSSCPVSMNLTGFYKNSLNYNKVIATPRNNINRATAIQTFRLTNWKPGRTDLGNWNRFSETVIPDSLLINFELQGTAFAQMDDEQSINYSIHYDKLLPQLPTSQTTRHIHRLFSSPLNYITEDGQIIDLPLDIRPGLTGPNLNSVQLGRGWLTFQKATSPLRFRNTFEFKINSKLSPTSAIFIPVNTNITAWFESSSLTFINELSSGNLGTNFSAFSSSPTNPIYFNSFEFSYNNKKAFTINYSPSASIVTDSVSSVNIITEMVDNFYQTKIPINIPQSRARSKFITETMTDNIPLSAKDSLTDKIYSYNQWFPTSANMTFFTDTTARYYDLKFITETFPNESYFEQDNVQFVLNRDKAKISFSQINVTPTSIDLEADVYPDYIPELNVVWSVDPPDNIIIRNLYDLSEFIPLNVPVPANDLSVRIENLGVEETTITLYSQQYQTSGSIKWRPDNNIWRNTQLRLRANITDKNSINYGSVSALFLRNNLLYPVPKNATIRWDEQHSSIDTTVDFLNSSNSEKLLKNAWYPSLRNFSTPILEIEAAKTIQNPQNIGIGLNCAVVSPFYSYLANTTVSIQEYPLNSNIFISFTSENGDIFSSKDYLTYVFSSSNTITLTAEALLDNLSVNTENIKWSIDNNNLNGISAIFTVNPSESICLNISALDVTPSVGGFGLYNFTDSICLHNLEDLPNFDYISFPSQNFFPYQDLNFDNYTENYISLSAYKSCHTQNIYFSAIEGFDVYEWQIGNKKTETNTNTAIIPVEYVELNSININPISVTGYNQFFPKNNPPSIYNNHISDNTIYKEDLIFKDIPTVELTIAANNDLINLNTEKLIVTGNIEPIPITEGNLNYRLYNNVKDISSTFTINNNIFEIEIDPKTCKNEEEVLNLNIFGTVLKTITGFDFCNTEQTVTSNSFEISAFNKPELTLWTNNHVVSTNVPIIIKNTTFQSSFFPFSAFIFNDGQGNITTKTDFSDFSAIYTSSNNFNISLTGITQTNDIIMNRWNNYISCVDNDLYDERINRDISIPLELPFQLKDVLVPPNSWQFNSSINNSLNKIQKNISFLLSQSRLHDNNLPTYNIGFFGEYLNCLKSKWNYTTLPNDEFINFKNNKWKSILQFNDFFLFINDNVIDIRNNDEYFTKITTIDSFNRFEKGFIPTKISKLQNNNICILDNNNKFVFICNLDPLSNELNLIHYWGGVGEKDGRTRLNNPTDISSKNDHIYIADFDSNNIKVYNKFYNWINIIKFENESPYLLSESVNSLFVYTNKGKIHKIIDFVIVETVDIQIEDYTSFEYSSRNRQFYFSKNNTISIYSENGTYITSFTIPYGNVQSISHIENDLIIVSDKIIYKYAFLRQYTSITTLPIDYSFDKTFVVDQFEPVSSFIFNDSILKLANNLNILNDSLTGIFKKNIDFEYVQSQIQAISSIPLDCHITPIGINEMVNYETINRNIHELYNCLEIVKDKIDGKFIYSTNDDIVWTWRYHKIKHNQRPNTKINPLSWEEIDTTSQLYSGVSWLNILSSTGFENTFPVYWTWENMTDSCLNKITWEMMETGRMLDYSWQDLEQKNPFGDPFVLFDNCDS